MADDSNVELGNSVDRDTIQLQPLKITIDTGTQTSPKGDEGSTELPVTIPAIFRFEGRHLQMMGLGAAIGSGLLFGTGEVLHFGGPVSLWLAYFLTGTVMYAVMITLGEMITLLPVPGGFIELATRCISPGFMCGWIYWLSNVLSFASQIVAAHNILAFWPQTENCPTPAWIFIIPVLPIIFNNFYVRSYGEIEYVFTAVKVTTITGLIVLGLVLPMGVAVTRLPGTDHNQPVPCSQNNTQPPGCLGPPGFGYWYEGAFESYLVGGARGQLLGFWACCCQALFAYVGVEVVGIAADETERHQEALPRAVRRVSTRILFYYVGATFVLGLNVSANDPILVAHLKDGTYLSPFVLMIERAGISVLPHIVNFVGLIAVLTVANADLYISVPFQVRRVRADEQTRTLYVLATNAQWEKLKIKWPKTRVPVMCVLISSAISVAWACVSIGTQSVNAFNFLSKLTTQCALVAWAVICWTYLRFRLAVKEQEAEIDESWSHPWQPVLAFWGLFWSSFFLIFNGFEVGFRSNGIWGSLPAKSWDFTIAPWVLLGLCAILILARWGYQGWDWQQEALADVNLHRGKSQPVEKREKSKNLLMRGWIWILNKI